MHGASKWDMLNCLCRQVLIWEHLEYSAKEQQRRRRITFCGGCLLLLFGFGAVLTVDVMKVRVPPTITRRAQCMFCEYSCFHFSIYHWDPCMASSASVCAAGES
eukprot:COSAG05_NODE_214_length_13907_cov_28.992178_2_plen_104_part_00